MRPRLLRPALAAGLLGLVATAGLAGAAPAAKPVCNLIVDEKGDTFLLRTQDSAGAFGPREDALDIVAGDLASDGKVITGVLRVLKLSKSAATSPSGLSFRMQFAMPNQAGTNLYMSATLLNGAESFVVGVRDVALNTTTKLADAKGVFDVDKSEVRITAPLSAFSSVSGGIKPGMKLAFADLDQTASRPTAVASVFADVTRSVKTYTVGAPSCVVPGK